MSSCPFDLGLPVVDEPKYAGLKEWLVLRAIDEADMMNKLRILQKDIPESVDALIYVIGYRPDKPVPVTRYFAEIEFREHKEWVNPALLGWAGIFQGTKEEET